MTPTAAEAQAYDIAALAELVELRRTLDPESPAYEALIHACAVLEVRIEDREANQSM